MDNNLLSRKVAGILSLGDLGVMTWPFGVT